MSMEQYVSNKYGNQVSFLIDFFINYIYFKYTTLTLSYKKIIIISTGQKGKRAHTQTSEK